MSEDQPLMTETSEPELAEDRDSKTSSRDDKQEKTLQDLTTKHRIWNRAVEGEESDEEEMQAKEEMRGNQLKAYLLERIIENLEENHEDGEEVEAKEESEELPKRVIGLS